MYESKVTSLLHSLSQNRLGMEQTEVLIQKLLRFFCILMRPAISFLKSKNFQLFAKKKFSLYPDRYLSPACWSQVD